jgi:hypothetical protein
MSPNIRRLPIFRVMKSENIFLTKLNMLFSSEGCKKNEVKTILLRNDKFKI